MTALRTLLRESDLSRPRVALAILTGSAALGSAVGLAAVAAWLIARAAGMPSPADLALAAVVVRFFGIGRGLFRYLERLVSHDAALRGVVALRARVYERLAAARADKVLGLRRGDTLSRIGADVDSVGDAVVRGIIPLGVAVVVSGIAVGINGWMDPRAGAVLAVALVVAGVGAAALTWRSARLAAEASVTADARVTEAVMSSVDAAAEHKVWGTAAAARASLREADAEAERAQDRSARPAAFAAALQALSAGAALVGCLWIAVTGAADGLYGPTTAAIIVLLPLASFEAVGGVPAAVTQLFRSRKAAERILDIAPNTPEAEDGAPSAGTTPDAQEPVATDTVPAVELVAVSAAWPGMTPTTPLSATVHRGGALAIVGRSGVGKTTLLTTIAGALAPAAGSVRIEGKPATRELLGTTVGMTAEDAHVFGTSILENLRVARGDVSDHEAVEALTLVGLMPWVNGLADGVHTVIGAGGDSISGGERRRLLLARAFLTPQPVVLIDEPAEHLDTAGRAALTAVLQRLRQQDRTVVIVTHHLDLTAHVDTVVSLDV
ncbi:thiol reductant ABC exporter subunit CydC [Demequina globuliformis]|uniref:thiol reductant ABC exporter subunit CydC n=1 Tax=Demequina globuliformis TaxID=676202 RepID=UPI000782C903|nr:thiol reductant ABC exporter subunit CydC [Demequina globuliformis]